MKFDVLWADEIVEHLAEYGVTQEDFEYVLGNAISKGWSRSSNLPCVWGYTADDRYVIAIYEEIENSLILPVTAYEVPEP